MFQTERNHAVTEWISQLLAGATPPKDFHHGARVYFSAPTTAGSAGSCIVCGTTLVGKQKTLCGGHWDWVPFEPLELNQIDVRQSIAEFLEIQLTDSFILHHTENVELARRDKSRCEVCDQITANVEELHNGRGFSIKRQIVCTDHQTFPLLPTPRRTATGPG